MDNDMVENVFQFAWTRARTGYHWVSAHVARGKVFSEVSEEVITAKDPYATELVQDDLMKKHTGLFRIFAETAIDEESIRAFANQFGLLGVQRDFTTKTKPADALPRQRGETLMEWSEHITAMKNAVLLWDAIRTEDEKALRRYIRWKKPDDDNDKFFPGGGWYFHDSPAKLHEKLTRLDPYYNIKPAVFLHPLLTAHLDPGKVASVGNIWLLLWINEKMDGNVSPCLTYDHGRGKSRLRFMPRNLLGAMWLQLAQAIDGEKEYKACKECGRWFEVSLEAARTNRVFCSDPCKSKDYRNRVMHAHQLKAQGKSVKEIAKELDSDVETIKKWVSKRKG